MATTVSSHECGELHQAGSTLRDRARVRRQAAYMLVMWNSAGLAEFCATSTRLHASFRTRLRRGAQGAARGVCPGRWAIVKVLTTTRCGLA